MYAAFMVPGPKKPAKTVTAGSTVSFAVLNRTIMPLSHLDIITNSSVLSYITPTTPPIQKDGKNTHELNQWFTSFFMLYSVRARYHVESNFDVCIFFSFQ